MKQKQLSFFYFESENSSILTNWVTKYSKSQRRLRHLNPQTTDQQSGVIPKRQLWMSDTKTLQQSCLIGSGWIHPIHLIYRIQYKIGKNTNIAGNWATNVSLLSFRFPYIERELKSFHPKHFEFSENPRENFIIFSRRKRLHTKKNLLVLFLVENVT